MGGGGRGPLEKSPPSSESLPPSPSSMGGSGAAGRATALGDTPFLVARGSLRESNVFRKYPRETSEEWLKKRDIFSKIWVSV